jgi:predicted deacylase
MCLFINFLSLMYRNAGKLIGVLVALTGAVGVGAHAADAQSATRPATATSRQAAAVPAFSDPPAARPANPASRGEDLAAVSAPRPAQATPAQPPVDPQTSAAGEDRTPAARRPTIDVPLPPANGAGHQLAAGVLYASASEPAAAAAAAPARTLRIAESNAPATEPRDHAGLPFDIALPVMDGIEEQLIEIEPEEADGEPVLAPIGEPEPFDLAALTSELIDEAMPVTSRKVASPLVPSSSAAEPPSHARHSDGFHLLGLTVDHGTFRQVDWTSTESMSGRNPPTPVLIANGIHPGPVVCLTAAVHGDELNGIEAVRRVMFEVDPANLRGTIIGVPIVNMPAFQRLSRYLPDRRDLNRYFPGNPRGSSAARIAWSLFSEVIRNCNGLVDIHTGSFHRANLPQLRADLNNPAVVAFTQGFGSTVILHGAGAGGTLRRAATEAGIPAVTLEMGEPLRVQAEDVSHAVKAIFTLLDSMGMYARRSIWGNPEPVYYTSTWVRADVGGILTSAVKLGERISKGATLGTVIDPISNERSTIASPYAGRVIGMAVDQFVMPGYAAYHIGLETPVEDVATEMEDADVVHDDPSTAGIGEPLD